MKELVLFSAYQMHPVSNNLKKKVRVNRGIVKIGQQMLKDQIRIFYSPIFVFSILSIKITSIIHSRNVHKWINQFPSYFDTFRGRK